MAPHCRTADNGNRGPEPGNRLNCVANGQCNTRHPATPRRSAYTARDHTDQRHVKSRYLVSEQIRMVCVFGVRTVAWRSLLSLPVSLQPVSGETL